MTILPKNEVSFLNGCVQRVRLALLQVFLWFIHYKASSASQNITRAPHHAEGGELKNIQLTVPAPSSNQCHGEYKDFAA